MKPRTLEMLLRIILIFRVAAENMKKAAKAKLPKKSTSHDETKFEDKVNVWRNKENVNVEKAASIIQNRKLDDQTTS